MVSWEFKVKAPEALIALNNKLWLVPFVVLAVLVGVNPIVLLNASGLRIIVPISGRSKPYDPEFATYPPEETALPLDPDTI